MYQNKFYQTRSSMVSMDTTKRMKSYLLASKFKNVTNSTAVSNAGTSQITPNIQFRPISREEPYINLQQNNRAPKSQFRKSEYQSLETGEMFMDDNTAQDGDDR